jgi:hypothetical protein
MDEELRQPDGIVIVELMSEAPILRMGILHESNWQWAEWLVS